MTYLISVFSVYTKLETVSNKNPSDGSRHTNDKARPIQSDGFSSQKLSFSNHVLQLHAVITMHSFSQNAIPYLIIFFMPRRLSPSAYFLSSICFNASAQAVSRFPFTAYFNSITMPVRSGVQMEISLYPSPVSALDFTSQLSWFCKSPRRDRKSVV